MRALSPLLLCAILTACGGGGGSPTTAPAIPSPPVSTTPPPSTPTPAPAPTLSLSSPTLRTIAGGSAIPLSAKLSSGGTVHWKLAAGAPGSLSADTGDTVRYLPPAGLLPAPAAVAVTASADGGASASMTLAVTPDPGAPGLYKMDWRTTTDPTMLQPWSTAADLAGNVYIMLRITNVSPTRSGPPSLVKIAPDGSITNLIGNGTWFGQPYSYDNANRLMYSYGFVVDRAGNILVGTGYLFAEGGQILKITPSGDLSVLAGREALGSGQLETITDGTGAAAHFRLPSVVGIDYDDNAYVLDKDNTPRRITPAGVVTTLSALPAGLNADMNGNTYAYDSTSKKLMRTGPDGVSTVETGVAYCTSFVPSPPLTCLDDNGLYAIVPTTGASLVGFTSAGGIRRLVLQTTQPH